MTDYQFNNHNLKQRRQSLRNNMPQPEALLWSKLRSSQLLGYKFRRQYGIGNYVVDFYCPKLRLAIEIDGDSHYNSIAQRADIERDNFIKSFNIVTIRFTNEEIMKNLTGVIEKITEFFSPTTPDKTHLHHRFLKAGFTARQAILSLWLVSVIFGLIALHLKTFNKIISAFVIIVLVVILIKILNRLGPAGQATNSKT